MHRKADTPVIRNVVDMVLGREDTQGNRTRNKRHHAGQDLPT